MQARKKGRSTNFREFLSEELQVFLAGRSPGNPCYESVATQLKPLSVNASLL